MSATTTMNHAAETRVVGVYGGSELLWKGGELRLRPAPWNECFYAKLTTYMQFGIFVIAMFLAPLLGYPTWPVLIFGIAVLAGYPLSWAMRQTILTKIIVRRDSDHMLIAGKTLATPRDLSVQVRRDALCGWILLMTVSPPATDRRATDPVQAHKPPTLRVMGHLDSRPVEALAEAIEKELGLA